MQSPVPVSLLTAFPEQAKTLIVYEVSRELSLRSRPGRVYPAASRSVSSAL